MSWRFLAPHLCSLLAGPCRQLTPDDLARVPPNTTSNILNKLLITYDPRIRPNFKGKGWLFCRHHASLLRLSES